MNSLRVYIGYDPREEIAFHVLARSIQHRASRPVSIAQVALPQLRGEMWREKDPKQSNAFSFSRFLVPYLAGYNGPALWLDCDMLCLGDIAELFALYNPNFAVQVVQQEHTPKETVKYLGQEQTAYWRKNWSSVMLFNAGHARCRDLTPQLINGASGLFLHQFGWCEDEFIGNLPKEWNHLVGVTEMEENLPKILHYTTGGPWFDEYRNMDYLATELWDMERLNMEQVQQYRQKMQQAGKK